MNSQHTPCPWHIEYHQDCAVIVYEDQNGHPTPIAELQASTEQSANAALIAQAPDLLDQVQDLQAKLDASTKAYALLASHRDRLAEAAQAALKEMQAFRAYWTGPSMNLARTKAKAEELCEQALGGGK